MLWRRCVNEAEVTARIVGRRYLRLDRAVEGYARLSPSIRREFLTYTLLDRTGADGRLEERAAALEEDIVRVSDSKRRLVYQAISSLVDSLGDRDEILARACFILAGDIVYNMAHRVPRPERSTGKMVQGSDLDLVVVTDDLLDPGVRTALDDAIYQKKHLLLVSPSYREELDYLIKDMSTVKRQLAFDTFEHMVAGKILHEGELLYGSREIFEEIKTLLRTEGIPQRLDRLEQDASTNRRKSEKVLGQMDAEQPGSQYLNLFYTTDEGDEIY